MNAAIGRGGAIPYIAAYAAAWGAAVAYLAARQADWSFPLISMAVFGLALPGLAWALTRKTAAPAMPVARPALELGAVLALLGVYAVGFLGYGMTAVRHALPPGREQDLLVLAVKLLVHVAAPALLLAALGARLRPLFSAGLGRRGVALILGLLGAVLVGLLAVLSPSLKQIAALHPPPLVLAWAAPAAFVWIALEAGLCEEFLFRAVLQTRLSAVLRSEAGAVVLGALLFALAHVPGLFLRGAPGDDGYSPDVLQVAAFAVATLSPLALLFGMLWARTRSLLLVVALHAAVDVLPSLPAFLRTWAGLG